jgi:diguanylate cyclase (GGDEF)-like protein/PAS domain S-box-containing protein
VQLDQEQRDLLLRALETAANAIYVTDHSGRILWVNEAFCRQSGYQRHESVGQSPRLLNSGFQNAELYRTMWETILSGRPWQGEMVDRRRDGSLYTVDQVITPLVDANSTVTHFIAIQHDVSEAARERDDIRKLAYYDNLTGLPNRVLILELLNQAIGHADTRRQMLAVMFLDLDHFKPVNDTHGHALGDKLLKAVAARLRSAVRKTDVVARLGGDEFVIMVGNLEIPEAATALAQKLVDSIGQPFDFDGRKVSTGASIGISLYPEHGDAAETLVDRADAAMYRAKTTGRSRYCIFDSAFDSTFDSVNGSRPAPRAEEST